MTSSLLPLLPAVDDILFDFAQSDGFWANLVTAFGTSYDVVKATQLRQQWQSRNFSQLPPIEVLSDEVLGTANGAYSSSTNKIYLSASFLNTASSAAIVNVILEEIGHYVDAQINPVDSAGDEGAIFAELVQGNSLDVATLDALRAENDQTTIIVNGESIQVEQADFTGTPGNDNITGTSGDDNISGLDGNDTLSGLGGNDNLSGGNGNDVVNGDTGNDDLAGDNGNDSLNGGVGNDLLRSDLGNDTINGGSGFDYYFASYSDRSSGLTMTYDPTTGNGTITIGSEVDTLISIESFNAGRALSGGFEGTDFNDFIVGTSDNENYVWYGLFGNGGDDTVSGGAGDDLVRGGEGNDVVNGDTGNDDLAGDNGNDSLNGGVGNDLLRSDLGNDTINGGSGFDYYFASYSDRSSGLTMTYDPTTGNGTITIGSEVDTLISIESFNAGRALSGGFEGTDFNDFIVGTSDNENYIWYGLFGNGGDDTVSGGAGDDLVRGGEGNDVVNGDTGNDDLAGDNGNDSLNGGVGNDLLRSDLGNDTINGGSGFDYYFASYSDRSSGLTMTYDPTTGNGTITIGSEVDTLISIESFNAGRALSGGFEGTDFNDFIVGTSDNENDFFYGLFGNDGDDTVSGGAGDDKVFGGEGNDVVNGDTGNDELYGQNNNDTLQGTNNGTGEQDYLVGGTGNDRFILADTTKTFYDDGNSTLPGDNDYATIADFNTTDDIIQLRGSSSNYLLSVDGSNTKLYINKPGSERDELIAVINNQTALSLTASYFSYVSSPTLPSITLAVSPASVTEDGTTNLVYTFTRSGVTTNPLTVNYTIGGTATLNTDYTRTGTNNTVTFAAGSSTATVTVNPTADTTVESDETVILTLASGTGYTVGTTTPVTGTINNDDTTVTLAVSPASVTEDGTTNLVYTFTRSGVTTNPLTVNYTIGGTATLNTDYTRTGTNNTVTFAAGSSTATVTIDPTADTIVESNETVILTLAAGTGYTIGTTTPVTGTINNDDFSQLSINDITVVEGKDNNAILTVTVDNPNPQQITVNYTTAPINATANVDYTSKTGTITIAPNTATATISIPILNDNLNEPDEVFTVTLSNPVNATINPDEAIGQVIITDTLQSAITRTLPNNVENLRLIGTNNINGTGNAGNNNITGNSGNNQINGGAGIDILTGGLGADIFIFQFGQSTISTSDHITDFAINSDKIDLLTQTGNAMSAPSSFSRAADSTVTTLDNLINQVFTDANGAITGNQGLGVNSAALVQVTTGAIAGTYLVINDSAAGFQSSNDLLINITGFTGALPALGSIPVGNFFI